MKVFLIVGACGSGKTFIMNKLIKEFKLATLGKVGMFYFHRSEKIICLGKYDGSTFEGSDKLSMAIMRDLPVFKKYARGKIVVCEGDRFMNSTFIIGTRPNIISILDDGAKGRKKRGSRQTERQIKSVNTRVSKLIGQSKSQCIDSNVAYSVLKDLIKES